MKGSATKDNICEAEEETELINKIAFELNYHSIGSDGFKGPFFFFWLICLSLTKILGVSKSHLVFIQ